jgi:hypothetical protein
MTEFRRWQRGGSFLTKVDRLNSVNKVEAIVNEMLTEQGP